MDPMKVVRIALRGDVREVQAQAVATRLRAALRNGIVRFHMDCAENSRIESAELIGYLLLVSKHIATAGGRIEFHGDLARMRALFDAIGQLAGFSWEDTRQGRNETAETEVGNGQNTDR